MKETREKEIRNKVFTKDNIRSFWREVNQEHQASQAQKNHSSIELTINCVDGTRYESEGSELLDEDDIIDLKKSKSINIDYHYYRLDRRISITLRHGDYGSSLIVSGKDRGWVALELLIGWIPF